MATTSPLAAAYLDNDCQDAGLQQLNATLQALGLENLTEVSVASGAIQTALHKIKLHSVHSLYELHCH